jgi:hypothetical protein
MRKRKKKKYLFAFSGSVVTIADIGWFNGHLAWPGGGPWDCRCRGHHLWVVKERKKEKLCVSVVLATSLNGWNICVFLEDCTGHLLGFRGSL